MKCNFEFKKNLSTNQRLLLNLLCTRLFSEFETQYI